MSLLVFRPRGVAVVVPPVPTVTELVLEGRDCVAGIAGCHGLDANPYQHYYQCPWCAARRHYH